MHFKNWLELLEEKIKAPGFVKEKLRARAPLEKELRASGHKESDINALIYLSEWVALLELFIFPPEKWNATLLLGHKEEKGVITYLVLKQKGGEAYMIHVKNLYKKLVKLWKESSFFPKEGRKFFLPSEPAQIQMDQPSLEEVIISLAAHEVRHRMQYHKLIRPFSPKSEKIERNLLLKMLHRFIIYLFRMRREEMKKEGKSLCQIRKRLTRSEFDAELIEELVLHKIRDCRTPREIASLLWTQPSKKEGK